VIEGNRRVAALRQIREEQASGIQVPQHVAAVLDAVPCLIVDQKEGQDPYFRETLMGIRHVGGSSSGEATSEQSSLLIFAMSTNWSRKRLPQSSVCRPAR
jgi:hypothetical protein